MDINQTVFNAIKGFLGAYESYGCDESDIKRFLFPTQKMDFCQHQDEAISIIKGIMTNHGKQELYSYVAELARVERGICEPESLVKSRDHVVHALLSFILGIYINENFLKLSDCKVNPFQWKLAGLFHDIGYPVQVATRDVLKPFTDNINRIKNNLGVTVPDVFFKVVPNSIDKLTNGASSLELIQKCLDKWGLNINTNREYNEMVDSGQIYHGIISSLAVLYIIDLMFQTHNPQRKHEYISDSSGITWDQKYFENDVIPACAAIFVHDLDLKSSPLDRKRAPLAFLLKLSDCLQDWDRPLAGHPRGIPNDKFDIQIANGKLVFAVADKDHRDKIANEVASSLIAPDIEIC